MSSTNLPTTLSSAIVNVLNKPSHNRFFQNFNQIHILTLLTIYFYSTLNSYVHLYIFMLDSNLQLLLHFLPLAVTWSRCKPCGPITSYAWLLSLFSYHRCQMSLFPYCSVIRKDFGYIWNAIYIFRIGNWNLNIFEQLFSVKLKWFETLPC